jgi:hypothetical protein
MAEGRMTLAEVTPHPEMTATTAAAATGTNFGLMLIQFCGCTQERDQCDPAGLSGPCPLAAFYCPVLWISFSWGSSGLDG